MKTSFTPGPWHRNIKPVSSYPIIFAGRNTHVAQVITHGLPIEEQEANARLIVAAPELLEACHAALVQAIGWQEVNNVLDPRNKSLPEAAIIGQLRKAIARATGKENS